MDFISHDLEPVLRVDGATFVGMNTSHGVTMRTLTWNLRDISIIGDLREEQFDVAEEAFEGNPSGAARVVVMRSTFQLSGRWAATESPASRFACSGSKRSTNFGRNSSDVPGKSRH